MITTLTVSAIVQSFAGMFLTDGMSIRMKRISVIAIAVVLFDGYTATHMGVSLSGMFDATMNGLISGLGALGIYHLVQPTDTAPQLAPQA